MRTITKLRMPLFGMMAFVLLVQLPFPQPWGIVGLVGGYVALGFWATNLRCPVCGGLASIRKSKSFGNYYGLGNTCAHCGADFHKV